MAFDLTFQPTAISRTEITMNIRTNEIFFIVLLAIVTIINVSDFLHDIQEGSTTFHLAQEAFLVIASLGGIGYLLWEVGQRHRELEQIKTQLTQATSRLTESNKQNEKLQDVHKQYRDVIDKQLNDWALTPSERDVAVLLLKGLSFEEIAGVRETKEKTVRQQATAIYRKSNLNGRHEFAAWFFEDFL